MLETNIVVKQIYFYFHIKAEQEIRQSHAYIAFKQKNENSEVAVLSHLLHISNVKTGHSSIRLQFLLYVTKSHNCL